MSPSPEVELMGPDLDEDDDMQLSRSDSFPHSHLAISITNPPTPGLVNSRTSPALEKDEHEFTQTANSLQLLRTTESMEMKLDLPPTALDRLDQLMANAEDESEETVFRRNKEAADALFGNAEGHLSLKKTLFLASSPMLNPTMEVDTSTTRPVPPPLSLSQDRTDSSFAWAELKSPETVELDELEDLFESY
jgi:hypothetical protein